MKHRVLIRAIGAFVAGFGMSWLLYPMTHGKNKRLPELYGIGGGCVLIDVVMYALSGNLEAVIISFVSQSLVGLGVAASRAVMELTKT